MRTENELFSAVDALLEQVPSDDLPPSAERKRLREAAGLSQTQVATALGTRRETVGSWEAGLREPRPPQRAAYARLLEGLAARFPPATPDATTSPVPQLPAPAAPEPCAGPPTPPAAADRAAASTRSTPSAATAGSTPTSHRQAGRNATARPAPAPAVTDPRFAHGPLGVLDGDGQLYCAGGLVLDCPAGTVPELVEWTLAQAGLGAARLHRSGKDSDPLIVLTAAAAERLGLPERLEDRRSMRLPEGHPVVKQIAKAKWQLTKRGFGPWARIYRSAQGGERRCVQLAVLPWDALDSRSWGDADQLPPAELARVLSVYAARVLTPRGSTAVAGLELMTALRPPTRAVKDDVTGTWVSGPVPGSLTTAVDPAPPEAPDEHPAVAALFPRGHQRTPDQVLDEEAFDWIRDPQQLTDAECAKPFAVGVDVNTAFLAAANRLVVGLGAPEHVRGPRFDKTVPGAWLVDLSGIGLDPRLPSPFTPHGERPTGPAWYATPTVAYALELIETYRLPVELRPLEAYLRRESGPYLDPWYKHLADAYKQTMADLGVTADLTPQQFLAAMEQHKAADPGTAMVLSAIKSTVKGGIGKLRERPQGASYRPGERWPALERPTWRPDIRAAVISAARVNMHRKLLKTAAATGGVLPAAQEQGAWTARFGDQALMPVALLSDCAVFPSAGPSPLDVLPYGPDGKPAPGTFRLGVSPGMVKHEGTQPLIWAVELLEQDYNPARHIKGDGHDAADEGE
ncbi:telomere-associated protein Tap [Streptomyces sp. NRRL F-5123]|uniref:telomere-associated protein Tap n=1 Tax=Streptomyces sp. NRRL F-5123 TaxID=1463856 RepID=UPI0004E102C1|nr:helix-turn-helix transcriptional regulator [Streptomyces sp. NRRL F-5123]